jgi:hypothetical protein
MTRTRRPRPILLGQNALEVEPPWEKLYSTERLAIPPVRRRCDGERRNPWDEDECGQHYARAMAPWSGIIALSGFRYDGALRQPAEPFA